MIKRKKKKEEERRKKRKCQKSFADMRRGGGLKHDVPSVE